jgi:transmembrane sensor
MDARERRALAAEAATEWWVCLQGGDASNREREQFVDWLRESPLHVTEMLRIARLHEALARFQGWTSIPTDSAPNATPGEAASNEIVVPFPPRLHRATHDVRGAPKRLRIAAALTCAVTLVALVVAAIWMRVGLGWQTIETERGERREVALADGSVLQVGPQTRLRVRFTDRERHVLLDHGGTLFRVAKNAHRPFIVEMDHTLVRAVGTAFAVEQRGQAVVVTVAEGKVAVLQHQDAVQRITSPPMPPESGDPAQSRDASGTARRPDQSLILIAGQQVAVPGSGLIGLVRKVDSERELAWASGRLVFEHAAIDHVIEQFNRFNRVQLAVVDEDLGRRQISGVFDASDPESFIAFLASVTPVRVIRRDAGTIELTADSAPMESIATENQL